MTDTASQLRDELAVFADLGTDAPRVMRHDDRLIVRMIRRGEELQLDFPVSGSGRVLERSPGGARPRPHASYKALLASEAFGDLRVWAEHQKMFLQEVWKDVGNPIRVTGVLSGQDRSLNVGELDDFLVSGERGDQSVRIMLIDGPAGIGKTKFIEGLVTSRARGFPTGRRPLVLHVQSRGRVLTYLQDLIAFSLQRLRLTVTFDQVPVLVRHGLVTLAIDGFDELGDPNGYDLAWGQVNEIVKQIRGGGTLILAGRETFIGPERIAKKITSLAGHDALDALSLQPPAPGDARAWLRARCWSDDDIRSADELFETGSYALRPFFLVQLADPDVVGIVRGRAAGHPLAFLVEVMVEREAAKFGEPVERVMSPEQRREFVRRFLREVARHLADDQTEAIDDVWLAWLVEVAVAEDVEDPAILGILKNRADVMAFLENDDAPRYRRFGHSQPFNYFLGEVTINAILNDEVPKFIRRNILGADFLAAFSDLILPLAASEPERVREFFHTASGLTRSYLSLDRGARNLGALLVTMLPALEGVDDVRIEGVAADESLIQGTAPPAVVAGVTVSQLDAQGADLRAVEFKDCWIGTLIVDETTRVPPSCPVPDRLLCERLGAREGSVIVERELIEEWLDRHGRVESVTQDQETGLIPDDLRNDERVTLLERACRSRAYWIPKSRDEDDLVHRFVGDPQWIEVLALLKEHDLVREDQLSSSGRKSTFFHVKRRADILEANPEDAQIRDFYASLVERIRVGVQ